MDKQKVKTIKRTENKNNGKNEFKKRRLKDSGSGK